MRHLIDLAKRFRKDESGAFIVLFGVLAVVLIAVAGSVVDFTYMQTARTRAQTAIDSAALALQTRIGIDSTSTLTTKAQSLITERLGDSAMTATVKSLTVDTTVGKIDISASLTVPTSFVQLVGIHSITSLISSEAVRGSKDLEVSVALDTTGSMAGSKIAALISAMDTANTGLIDLVVKDQQTPTYSKMAIVPWTNAVNLGTAALANNVRGTPTPGVALQSATWKSGSAVNISGITKANPAVVTTSTNHGLSNGDPVYITGVKGMTSVNGSEYIVTNKTANTFQLYDTSGNKVDTTGASSYTSKGTVQKCLTALCEIVITTASPHGYVAGDIINNVGTSGLSSPVDFDGVETVGTVLSTTSFVWPNVFGPAENAYSSGGTTYCTKYGCVYYYFPNAAGTNTLYQANNCATERTTNAYTDAKPSTTWLGFNYTSNASACITQVVQPLTSDKTALHNLVKTLTATGSTAGHLGLAWGWYMVAPNFGYLWPSSAPAAYGRANLIKAVILMTDGQFNEQYCNGVLDSDVGSGTGNINCTSPNGDSHAQAVNICNAIKAASNDIILYTVGFYLGNDTASLNFLKSCATAPSDFFQADSSTDLSNAFTAIAQNLNNLRISK